jgi:23S rRNA (cytosine1962-C5)-methyltransferase
LIVDLQSEDLKLTMSSEAIISGRGEERVRLGHPWIYRSDLVEVSAAPGDVVDVLGRRRRLLGRAFYSSASQIALRMLARGDVAIDAAFWRARLEAALGFRRTLIIDATAFRVVHAEADLLPSLIVDQYGEYLVVQTLSQGSDRALPDVLPLLVEMTGARGVLARNDPRVRRLEGLDQTVAVVHGDVPQSIVVREGQVEFDVDLWRGQKTGLFLDQRENRAAAAGYVRGRVLDCFSYHGGFALQLARHASAVTALEMSADAVSRIAANAAKNGLGTIDARAANVFDELRHLEREGARYDAIVLDPPAFAKNKASIPRALAGYKEINLRALRLLNPGGYLVTCSCSYNVDEATFGEVVYEASVDSHAQVTVVEKRMQSRDHPVLLGVPETYYLKCLVLRKL